jgi:hypothetical protein
MVHGEVFYRGPCTTVARRNKVMPLNCALAVSIWLGLWLYAMFLWRIDSRGPKTVLTTLVAVRYTGLPVEGLRQQHCFRSAKAPRDSGMEHGCGIAILSPVMVGYAKVTGQMEHQSAKAGLSATRTKCE